MEGKKERRAAIAVAMPTVAIILATHRTVQEPARGVSGPPPRPRAAAAAPRSRSPFRWAVLACRAPA